ncbi:DUF5677 domain-containing protein [Rhizobium sp. TRM95111]|uniref:DUF5677 domain-containing protein n=1 Tax=Rhizobium alarense TaxID=2846851 RepID=UPI001F2504A2|nr:DUF5677 domain-containing protein [Rhizobium alarense]MCF3641509.1 DUF5677 domain-containing protein [Rhizobium alarense]
MQNVYDLLTESFEAATEEMLAFKFDGSRATDRTIASLYATIYEETDAAICLYDNKKYTGAHLILRPLLEAHVDLVALIRDPGYIEFMEARHNREWLRFLKNGDKGTNPFLKFFWNNADVKKKIHEAEQRLAALKTRNIRPLKVAQRFGRADMTEEYESVYNNLCCHTHNDIRALEQRHIEPANDKKTFQIVINAKPGDATIGTLLDGLLGFILSSSLYVHRHFNSAAVARFEELDARRAQLLKKITAPA